MNAIKKKLKSQRGISILIALLFLLTCLMVGSAVVASASGNTDKNTQRKERQMQYQALASAIRFVENTVDGKVCTGSESKHERGCITTSNLAPDEEAHENVVDKLDLKLTVSDGKLQDYIITQANRIFLTKTKYYPPSIEDLTDGIKLEFLLEGEGMPPVVINLHMKDDYTLACVLRVKDSKYNATLLFRCAVENTTTTITDGMGCTHNIVRLSGAIESKDFSGLKSTITTTLTWKKVSIEKGDGSL